MILGIALNLILAPALAGLSTVATRRWGARVGGVVSAFPAIAGPVLLITAIQRGRPFASHTANGVLVGLIALSAFAASYGHNARRGWGISLAAGWAAAALCAFVTAITVRGTGSTWALLIAAGSLALGIRALPGAEPVSTRNAPHGWSRALVVRMALSTLLVAVLAFAVATLGALIGGMLASLPVVVSVLVVFIHREQGDAAALTLLRGVLTGMGGFVAFCEVLAVTIVPCGIAVAFGAATLAALALQTIVLCVPRPAGEPSIP